MKPADGTCYFVNDRHGAVPALKRLWWRFYWLDSAFNRWGLHFDLGPRRAPARLWGTDCALQLLIFALTAPGLWLVGNLGAEAKWGFAVLLAAQPLWLAATWRAGQFGMFAIALVYTAIWVRSVFNHF